VTGVWVGYDQPRTIIPDGYAAQLAVPMWARFMISATRGESAERFTAPRSVAAATICPLSGKLATDACYREHNASVYTEYFERGTEPTEYCPYHTIHSGSPVRLASGAVAPIQAPVPGSARSAVAAASTPATAAPQAEPAASAPVEEAPKKKRGFWSRVFGVGR
jgi:penicillin-binding protein 1A